MGNLAQALTLLRDSISGEPSDSLHVKEALGVLLRGCGQQTDIEVGRQVHKLVSTSTQFRNDFVLNTRVITMYSMCGSPLDSRSVFDSLQRKNLFQWNAIVSGYTRNELYHDALKMFLELLSNAEFIPDNFTLPCVIKACGGILDVRLGQVVHGMVVKMGLIDDVFVGNALISMYGKCGYVVDAAKVFEVMPERNLVSWNSMISVFSDNGYSQDGFCLFSEMVAGEKCLIPDTATLVTVLPVCAGEGEVETGIFIHGLAVKLGLDQEATVNNALVDMYSKCGYLLEAQLLFDKNGSKNVVSWNTMIGGFSTCGDVHGTFDVLRKMQMEKEVKANEITILNVLPVCVEELQLLKLKELHGYSFRHGFQYDELVANALVAAYAKCGSLSYAQDLFSSIRRKTVSSWNALIGGYAQNGDPRMALDLYRQMKISGFEPDWYSIGSLLLACTNLKSLPYGKEIHGFVLRNGFESDSFIDISLLSLYIHCGRLLSAQALFNGMQDRSLVSWNTMITGYSQNGLPEKALELFRQMLYNKIQPYEIAIISILGACSQLSALRLGKETHCYAMKALLTEDTFVGCSIIDMYAKCGCIEQSQKVFDTLENKDVASWNAIILGYGIHGHGGVAIQLFEKMQTFGQKPDYFTFIGILIACNHAGLVEEGLKYFNKMQDSHGLKPKLEHCACVIDMLGRAGQLDNALSLINQMSEEPDAGIWSSLLSSCRIHGALDMGEKVARKLIEMEPNKAENYVLLSNLFAGSGKWDEVRRVRQKMKQIGLQKDAGCSWIELSGKIYSFMASDNSLPESDKIRETWRSLEEKICKIGYKPNACSVLHELGEKEKVEILRGHSEKLAISFGLLKSSKGKTLRICKNLRICLDCHNAMKLISKVVEREIVIRDNKRFHHFRDGVCSCGDFW